MTKNKKKPAGRKPAAGKSKKVLKKPDVGKRQPRKEEYPHFRYHKKTQHPALIVGEQKGKKTDKQGREKETEEYKYRKVMHSERDGRHLNEKISPNPNPQDSEPMYIGKRIRHDEKKNFGEKYPWKYPIKDEKKEVPPHGCK